MTRSDRKSTSDARTSAGDDADGSTLQVFLHHLVTAVIVAALLGTVVWLYLRLSGPARAASPGDDTASRRPPATAARLIRTRQRVETALRVSRHTDGRAPESLELLVRKGLLVPRDLYYASGDSKFRYRRLDDGYRLDTRPPSSDATTSQLSLETHEP